ncbi:hypothetical protein NA57DRAFT_53156 [Rhizodiscina lignyota]|uniref:F-box domain-containing protein n=1 Tax=Rhizodiscina lignyota TaxID=1504668 RepID=A0A9P4IKS6_9PEZI|nr:hypothetical protein NA57DRAFT_53156 [Rhizodiscina lignyota]
MEGNFLKTSLSTEKDGEAPTKHFIALPVEIRLMIYGFVVEEHVCACGKTQHRYFSFLNSNDGCKFDRFRPPHLAEVCKTIRNELLPIFYGNKSVFIHETVEYGYICGRDDSPEFEKWSKTIGERNVSLLKRIVVGWIGGERVTARIPFSLRNYYPGRDRRSCIQHFAVKMEFERSGDSVKCLAQFPGRLHYENNLNYLRRSLTTEIDKHMSSYGKNKWDGQLIVTLARAVLGEDGIANRLMLPTDEFDDVFDFSRAYFTFRRASSPESPVIMDVKEERAELPEKLELDTDE